MKKPIITEIIIWTILLTIIFSIVFFGYSKLFVEPNIYTIQFKDIDGITTGSPVRFMGINVGHVRNLKSHDKYVNVEIIVTKKNMKIPNGTVARVEFYGLGGSKSVELMPPDGSCDVGILTGDTIRINDVVQEAVGMVHIIEEIEKYVKGLDKAGMYKFLVQVGELKNDKIIDVSNEISQMSKDTNAKILKIKNKQKEISEKIETTNKNLDKINRFIKK